MEFSTFANAYSYNRRSKEHLINLIKTRVDQTPEFSLFLGAGASVSSGVKSASEMISDWQKKLFVSTKSEIKFEDWLIKQEWHGADDQYSRLFEKVYDQPAQRRAYIETATKNSKPNWGYAYLSSLIENNLFNVIFTTNFDDLINEACYRFTDELRPMVCAHDSSVSSVRLMSDRPKVIKLHGDFLFDSIKNTSSELQSLEANMRDKFIEFAKEYGLIVVGYSGSDQSVMDMLDILVRSDNYFRNGIYWCVKSSTSPGRRLRRLLRNDRIYWVEIDGFDEFMGDLGESTSSSLPSGIIYPHQIALDRTKHLLKCSKEFKSPILERACNDLNEVYSRINGALTAIGLSDWSLDKENKSTMFNRLKEEQIPFLQCMLMAEGDNYKDAIEPLKKLVDSGKNFISEAAWDMLLRCLIRDTENHDLAKKLIDEPPPESWQDSTHFLQRCYYCLYLNMYDKAIMFADRSIELNSGMTSAKINKCFAYLICGENDKFTDEISKIESNILKEHHLAAIYAMKGEFESCIISLQKACVLGRYTVEDACKDIVFRVYWHLPQFKEALKHFSKKEISFPYISCCPMSEKENEILNTLMENLK